MTMTTPLATTFLHGLPVRSERPDFAISYDSSKLSKMRLSHLASFPALLDSMYLLVQPVNGAAALWHAALIVQQVSDVTTLSDIARGRSLQASRSGVDTLLRQLPLHFGDNTINSGKQVVCQWSSNFQGCSQLWSTARRHLCRLKLRRPPHLLRLRLS
jgi:hypothetical protein